MSVQVEIQSSMRFPAALVATLAASTAAFRSTKNGCAFWTAPVVQNIGGGYRSFVWTEPYRANLFQDGLLMTDGAWHQYSRWLDGAMARNFADVNPWNQRALLIRQRDIFKRHRGDSGWAWDVLLDGRAGRVSRANCIESLLWAKQNELHPQKSSPTEFGAYILVDRANQTVKIFAQTGPSYVVKPMHWARSPMNQLLNSGWTMLTFLHNHPFFAHNPGVDCAGTVVPSSDDLRAFKLNPKYNSHNFWITNGYDSFRVKSYELVVFDWGRAAVLAEPSEGSLDLAERPEGPLDLSEGPEGPLDSAERPEGPLDLILQPKKDSSE